MYIFAGIVLIFMPFLFFIILGKNTSELLKIDQNLKLPHTISLFNSVKWNYSIIKQNLMEEQNFTETEALKICKTIKKTQLSLFFYISGGFIQIFGIVAYSVFLFPGRDIAILYSKNSNQLGTYIGTYIGTIIMACFTFWIFYAEPLFEYIGLNKAKNVINSAFSSLFEAQEKLEKKLVIFSLSCLYFLVLLVYLNYFTPIVQLIGGVGPGVPLIRICLLLFSFYYGAPKLFSVSYSVLSKSDRRYGKEKIYRVLKNSTYLHLLILYFYLILSQKENHLLLSGITILFLFDTYLQNRKEIISSPK